MRQAVARFLNRRVAEGDAAVPDDVARLHRHVRRWDVVLVDGELRFSQLVKYATQSQWSHSALYVGDELIRRGGWLREEALVLRGTCRPSAHRSPDRPRRRRATARQVRVAQHPHLSALPHRSRHSRPRHRRRRRRSRQQYDDRNFLDLAVPLLSPIKFGPLRTLTVETCLGRCTDLQVICSAMIAKAFHMAGYPVLSPSGRHRQTPRHYFQIMPRDFDLSPNFEIIKFIEDDVVVPSAARSAVVDAAGGRRRRGSSGRSMPWRISYRIPQCPGTSGIRRTLAPVVGML